ncbi:MAG: hypothetical protein AAF573_11070 [Bacteroidota bacterium]
MSKLYVLLILLSYSLQVSANYFEFTPLATEAYEKAMSLRFEEARKDLEQLRSDEPQNTIVHFIENYIDFFTIFINEDKSEFKRLERNKNPRLKAIRKGDRNSPYYLYCQAEIKLQWALARLKFEQYFNAFNEVSSAYKLLKRNQKKFPDFIANKKSLGILHAMVGTVPDNYKWGVKLLGGMTGTIEQGRKEVEEVLTYAKTNDFLFEEETLVMYAFLMLHLKNDLDEAWEIIQSDKLNPKSNPLVCFSFGNIAMRTGRIEEAINILENRPVGQQYFKFRFLDYMLGLSKLYRLDQDADVYLKKYVDNFNGQNYIKEAYQKLAWHYLVHGSEAKYKEYITYARSRGAKVIGGDKSAEKEAKSEKVPHTLLLKARLLFDGGYYERARDLLKGKSLADFYNQKNQLEFTYRLGRINHNLGYHYEAIANYQTTIDRGRYATYYFACNAALQIGLIHEMYEDKAKAKEFFKLCLDIDPEEYQRSLHQKAKAGLNRLK